MKKTQLDISEVKASAATRLSDHQTDETFGWDKGEAELQLQKNIEELSRLQERLYASGRWSVLLVFQALDAAGKDSVVKHVLSGINPQGVSIHSFKAPTDEERSHDFLWRCSKKLPERGKIGVFIRSYYEEVLVVRVHPNLLVGQRLPQQAPEFLSESSIHKQNTEAFWNDRMESIRDWEKHLYKNGTMVLKFFLNVSKDTQLERFQERLDDPNKNFKFSVNDLEEMKYREDYLRMFQSAIRETTTSNSPWYIIPADKKWVTRLAVSEIVKEKLSSLQMPVPTVSSAELKAYKLLLSGARK